MKLKPRQEAFCLEYASSGNATESYKKAYGEVSESSVRSNACRLLKNPKIQERLQELADEFASAKIANAKEMQEKLTAIIREEIKEEVLVTEMIGDGQSETVKHLKKPCIKDMVNAIDKLARMQGAYEQNATLNVVVPVFTGESDLED